MDGVLLICVMILTLAVQAIFSQRKMVIIFIGATVSVTLSVTVGHQTMKSIYANVPWEVLAILIGLGIFSSLMAKSGLFDVLAVLASRVSRGSHLLIIIMFSSIMFFLSGILNNLTALLLLLPVLISILNCLGTSQKFIALCFSLIIVACNLGGASTPIGDFPAILLMGTGSIAFVKYLFIAFPICLLLFLVILLLSVPYYQMKTKMNIGKVESSIGLSVLRELYRNLRIKKSLLFAGLLTFLIMFSLWTFGSKIGISPDIVCFLGIGPLLLLYNSEGEDIIKNKVDFETILFLACLFIMVSCMAGSGILNFIAISMSNYIRSPQMLIFMLMIGTGISTSIFSAGPSMATMLPIAQQVILQGGFPADVVLVGIALSVCAGSSLFLTAATAGPLSQNMIEKSKLTTQDGEMAKFDLMAYLRFGLVYFVIIQLVAVFFVLFNL